MVQIFKIFPIQKYLIYDTLHVYHFNSGVFLVLNFAIFHFDVPNL